MSGTVNYGGSVSAMGRWTTAAILVAALFPEPAEPQARITGIVRGNGSGDVVENALV